MNVEIVDKPFSIDIYGFSGVAVNKDYVETAFKLSGRMWETVKSNNLKNKGINIWVYEPGELVSTGVELDNIPVPGTGLELKRVSLTKYAYYKHIGPYRLIKQVGQNMQNELSRNGF